jgi:hypothetical protein
MRIPLYSIVLRVGLALPTHDATAQTARVGGHYGVNLTEGEWEQERLGVQGEVRAVGPMAVSAAVSKFVGWPGVTGISGSAWQVHANVRFRARGKWSFVSVGYGFVGLHSSVSATVQPGTTVSRSDSDFADTAVLGLEAPVPHVRPFADLYFIYILDRQGQLGVNLLMGLQVPIPLQ